MKLQPISSDEAPKAIGPYSQAIAVDGAKRLVFLSGQIPLDPETGEIVEGDVAAQVSQVLRNLGGVLKEADLDYDNVVKTTIFLTDLGDFAKVNELYGRVFNRVPPARSTVQVAALPRGVKVEIEAVAVA